MDMTQYAGSESQYLKASDLQGSRPTVVIESVELVEFEDDEKGKITKPALKLQGKKKKLVLSPSGVEEIIRAFGKDSSGWAGKSLGLQTKFYKSLGKEGIVVTPLQDNATSDVPF